MLHMMSLPTDKAAQMNHNSLRFLPLTDDVFVGVLKGREFFLVTFAFTFQFLGDLLLDVRRRFSRL